MPDLTFTEAQHNCLATTHDGRPCGPDCLWYPCSDPMEDRCATCLYMRYLHTTDGTRGGNGATCRQFT